MNKQTALVQTFDYSQLDAETSALCHRTAQIAGTFMQFARRTIDKGIELGEHLILIKEKLPHGQYKWYIASIGVPYQVAYYWTHKVREQRQLEIIDIYYLPEGEQEQKLDIKLLPEPDGLINKDVVIEDQDKRITELEQQKQELQTQLQDTLRQGTAFTTPKQHHGGGGGHHGLPTSTKDGVTRTMLNYDRWETTALTIPVGFACDEIQMGVRDDMENDRKAIVYIQNTRRRRTVHLDPYISDRHVLAKMFEELARELRK